MTARSDDGAFSYFSSLFKVYISRFTKIERPARFVVPFHWYGTPDKKYLWQLGWPEPVTLPRLGTNISLEPLSY